VIQPVCCSKCCTATHASHPAVTGNARQGQGQAIEHEPGTTTHLTSVDLQSGSSLNTCDLASHGEEEGRQRDSARLCFRHRAGVKAAGARSEARVWSVAKRRSIARAAAGLAPMLTSFDPSGLCSDCVRTRATPGDREHAVGERLNSSGLYLRSGVLARFYRELGAVIVGSVAFRENDSDEHRRRR
jgi:hypothetical protein